MSLMVSNGSEMIRFNPLLKLQIQEDFRFTCIILCVDLNKSYKSAESA